VATAARPASRVIATIDDEIPAAAGDRYDPTGMATVQQ